MADRARAGPSTRGPPAPGRSRRAATRPSLVTALALALAAWASPAGAERHPLVPDHAKLQLAGTIGFLSTGAGWAVAGRRLELDVLGGWVPPRYTGTHLFTATLKATWLPLSSRLERWRLRPLTLALALNHTWGGGFWVRQPSRYPSGYYPVPTALRWSLAVGGTLGRSVGSLRELALYWEVVGVDMALVHWARNPRTVEPADVLSLALGARVEF
jgi:hypothetical protein